MKLYDLTSDYEARFFSPGCVRARLSLFTKGVDFETVEVKYDDLRHYWTDKLECEEKATGALSLPSPSQLNTSFAPTSR